MRTLTIFFLLYAPAVFSQILPAETIAWRPTIEVAVEEAARAGKPILIDVYADWCPWCRRIQQEVYTDSTLAAYVNARFIPVRLNGEIQSDTLRFRGYVISSAELARALGVEGYPTTAFLDAESEFLTRLPGFSPPDTYLPILEYLGSEAYIHQSFQDFLAQRGR